MDGYYTRRKRNLDLSHLRQPLSNNNRYDIEDELEEDFEEIELEPEEDDEELEEGYDEEIIEYHEPIERYQSSEDNNIGDNKLFIDGKRFVPKPMKQKQTFAETHVRITTYLEKNIHQIIRMLQSQGQIESITKFLNDSVKEYLMNNFHNEN